MDLNLCVKGKKLTPKCLQTTETQTSKTILELAAIETTKLQSSPIKTKDSLFTFKRISDVRHDIDGERDLRTPQRMSLIQSFLNKHNSSTKSLYTSSAPKPKDSDKLFFNTTRKRFLQQTSPLRNIPKDIPYENGENIQTKPSRFNVVKNMNPSVDCDEYVKSVQKLLNNPENNNKQASKQTAPLPSYMLPTISSECKNLSPEVNATRELGLWRRGRSASPPSSYREPIVDKPIVSELNLSTEIGQYETKEDDCSSVYSLSGMDKNSIYATLMKVRSCEWNTSLQGLAEIARVSRDLQYDDLYPYMSVINQKLLEHIRSPRSHVCRTACQIAGQLFETMKDTRRPEFDDLVNTLLMKTTDSNRFIREDANISLDLMVTNVPLFHSVRALCAKGPSHKNSVIRKTVARLLNCAAVIAGDELILSHGANEFTRKRVLVCMANFINDKNYETRRFGEKIHKVLCGHPNFELYLKKIVDKGVIAQMKRSLQSLSSTK